MKKMTPGQKVTLALLTLTALCLLCALAEAAAHLGLSKRAAQKAAQVEQWDIVRKVGNVNLYDGADVLEYRDHRYRTQLARALGWRSPHPGQGLYRDDTIDISCPVCGAFAIEWTPLEPNKFMCLKGHEGKI